MSQEPASDSGVSLLPLQILPLPFDDLCEAARERLTHFYANESQRLQKRRLIQLQDFIFNLESMVLLDGEHRADSIKSRLLRWSGPGFTKRFFSSQSTLTEARYIEDHQFVTSQLEDLLSISHYQKLSPDIVEQSMRDLSYEKIFVRLQNVDFLNFYVRGSYVAQQRDTLTRSMAKRIQAGGNWVNSFIPPDSVKVFEEVVVVASEETSKEEERREESLQAEESICLPLDKEQMNKDLAPYLDEEKNSIQRPVAKRRRAIQRLVQEKMRSLQGKTLDEIMAEHTPDPNCLKHLHLLVYHNIPASDLELLLPNAEISLGFKEYAQLCFTGTATLPALGKVFLNRGLRKLLMVFNPIFYGIYRVLYKINIVRTEQKYLHARYLLNHRLARGGKAVSHLIDDYENVLKREALLIFILLAFETNPQGLSRKELETEAEKFVRSKWKIPFDADFSRTLRVLRRWGIVQKLNEQEIPRYQVIDLDQLVSITTLTRENMRGKIWLGFAQNDD